VEHQPDPSGDSWRLDELRVEAKFVSLDQPSADFGDRIIAEEVEFLKEHLQP